MADAMLIHATAIYEATIHSCGHPIDVCTDPANEGRFHAEGARCFATAAAVEYREEHKDEQKDESYSVTTRLLDPGEESPSRGFDPEVARREHRALLERHGLA